MRSTDSIDTEERPEIKGRWKDFPTYIKTRTSIPPEILPLLIIRHIVTKDGKIEDVEVFKNSQKSQEYAPEISRILKTITEIKSATYKRIPVDREIIYGFSTGK